MTALSPPTTDFLRHLVSGSCGQPETDLLEHTSGAALVAELRSVYRLTFQERRIRDKWEVSLARRLRTELAARPIPGSVLVSLVVVPVYTDCVMLNIEDDSVTGISRFKRLRVRAVGKPAPGLVLTMSPGFKLDRTPDGWALKPLKKKTVRLGEDFLKGRGWQFHHLAHFVPTP